MMTIAELNRRKRELCRWLDHHCQEVFSRKESQGQNYAAITESPPPQVFLFEGKRELLRFLEQHEVSAYRYRHHDEMIQML